MNSLSSYKCCKCGQLWRYLPKRETNSKLSNALRRETEDELSNGQCDCGHFIDIKHCKVIR